MIRLGNALAAVFAWLERLCWRASTRLKRCPTCGENLFYGRSCRDMGKL
jgi:hypothetical protein